MEDNTLQKNSMKDLQALKNYWKRIYLLFGDNFPANQWRYHEDFDAEYNMVFNSDIGDGIATHHTNYEGNPYTDLRKDYTEKTYVYIDYDTLRFTTNFYREVLNVDRPTS